AAVCVLVADAVVACVAGGGAVARGLGRARARGAVVTDGAEEAVVAELVVRRDGIGAGAGRRVAHAGDVADVARGADDGVGAEARARGAVVALGAGVAVVAAGRHGGDGVGAGAGRRVAGAGEVADVARRADDRVAPEARTRGAVV